MITGMVLVPLLMTQPRTARVSPLQWTADK